MWYKKLFLALLTLLFGGVSLGLGLLCVGGLAITRYCLRRTRRIGKPGDRRALYSAAPPVPPGMPVRQAMPVRVEAPPVRISTRRIE